MEELLPSALTLTVAPRFLVPEEVVSWRVLCAELQIVQNEWPRVCTALQQYLVKIITVQVFAGVNPSYLNLLHDVHPLFTVTI
jgi:hypothetical protein